ncbi:MAG: hypothetical protein GY849_08835 [Deltaproteobacteria bacterium]|nr:hypothetical protein [Deltaproteobacteria bacterium]
MLENALKEFIAENNKLQLIDRLNKKKSKKNIKNKCSHPIKKRVHNFDGKGHEACECGMIHGWCNQMGNKRTDEVWYNPFNNTLDN